MQQQVTRSKINNNYTTRNSKFLSNMKDTGGLMELFSGPLLVVVLFILFNLGVVDKTLTRVVPLKQINMGI